MPQILTKTMSRAQAEELLHINSWGNWSCGAETFDWSYDDCETCYLFEGDADIIVAGAVTHIEGGMLVHFPAGLDCVWAVKKPIRKAYKFGLDVDAFFA